MKRQILHFMLLLGMLASGLFAATAVSAGAQDASPVQQDTGTLRITLRGCPDGVDPNGDSTACTIPLDAPADASVVEYLDDATIPHRLGEDLDRENDGTYRADGLPAGVDLGLTAFQPVEHNHYTFEGVDNTDIPGFNGELVLQAGEERHVTVYYWNGSEGPSDSNTATVQITLRGCPEGVDPDVDASQCTDPLDAPDSAVAQWESGEFAETPISAYDRLDDGTYVVDDIPSFTTVSLMGFEPSVRDYHQFVGVDALDSDTLAGIVHLDRGEVADVTVYYAWNDGSGPPPEETASLAITMRGCPDGVDPGVDATECTIPLDAPPASIAFYSYTGDVWSIADLERAEDGTYLLEDLEPGTYAINDLQGTEHTDYHTVGNDDWSEQGVLVVLQPDATREVTVYYYND